MTHQVFDVDKVDWESYFRTQQQGSGEANYDDAKYFRGFRYQRGGGLKNVLGSVGRFLRPIALNLAESAKQEAGAALGRALTDVREGKSIGDAVSSQSKQALHNLGSRIQSQCGKGKSNTKILKDIMGEQQATPSGPNPISLRKNRRKDYLDF
jgi:hypothetical protein